jgi:hypothetical protein
MLLCSWALKRQELSRLLPSWAQYRPYAVALVGCPTLRADEKVRTGCPMTISPQHNFCFLPRSVTWHQRQAHSLKSSKRRRENGSARSMPRPCRHHICFSNAKYFVIVGIQRHYLSTEGLWHGPYRLPVLIWATHQHDATIYVDFYLRCYSLTLQLRAILPYSRSLLGLHNTLYPQSRDYIPNALELINHRSKQALALAPDCKDLLQYHWTAPEPTLRYSACTEFDREHLVLSASRKSW